MLQSECAVQIRTLRLAFPYKTMIHLPQQQTTAENGRDVQSVLSIQMIMLINTHMRQESPKRSHSGQRTSCNFLSGIPAL